MPKISYSMVACVATGVVAFAAYANTKSTKDGVFTVEQMERGKVVYEKSCGTCHQADIRGRLTRFEGKSVSALYEVVSTAMPADNPGVLMSSEYIDALAYIFSITGSPPGKDELTTDNIEAVSVEPLQ